jgi:hypothetical protein
VSVGTVTRDSGLAGSGIASVLGTVSALIESSSEHALFPAAQRKMIEDVAVDVADVDAQAQLSEEGELREVVLRRETIGAVYEDRKAAVDSVTATFHAAMFRIIIVLISCPALR